MSQLERQVQVERLVIVADVFGPAGSGKTSACAEIINAVSAAIGANAGVKVTSRDDVLLRRMFQPAESDHTKIGFQVEAFHNGT